MRQKKRANKTKRELINEHLPYELYAFATIRYYAQLQDLGALDVVDLMMHIEGVTEEEALARCLSLLQEMSERRFKFVERNLDLIRRDPDLDFLTDHFKKN